VTIDSLDASNTCDSLQTELFIEMEPYSLRWTPSLPNWNGREISVLLPSNTQYSRGMIKDTTENGTNTQDLVDASTGIPVSESGKVDLSVTCRAHWVINNARTLTIETRMAKLSLFLLEEGVSKEEYLDRLKKKNVEVLSQTNDFLITLGKDPGFLLFDTLEKTIISGNVILQIRSSIIKNPNQTLLASPFYQIFEKIAFATKDG
jgi:hypothetical protein